MDGVININKPQGITSFDVVRKIKKITGLKRIGHTGTLDPLASGVLPICIGKATKAVDYIMNDFKIYKAELKLGLITDTYDRKGKILETSDVTVTEDEVIKCINSFIGINSQIPPKYSAIKINGKRAYDLARKGIEVNIAARNISIYEINIINIQIPYVTFTVNCSKGTYIRSLCYDIGLMLNCGATMWNLERIQSGNFSILNSVNLDELNVDNINNYLIPIDQVLNIYEPYSVDKNFERLLINGVCVGDRRLLKNLEEDKTYRVYNEEKMFLGLGKMESTGFKLEKIFI